MSGDVAGWASRLVRGIRRALRPRSARDAARLIARADHAREAGQRREAATLYAEALALTPGDAAIHVQAGHMFKEVRDFTAAERHYHAAERLTPTDADLQLQLGHFNKTADRLDRARAHYARAVALASGWAEPASELAELFRREAAFDLSDEEPGVDAPAPELVPDPVARVPPGSIDIVRFRRLGGRRHRTATGTVPSLSGVEAIHGICFCDRPLVEATVLVDGAVIAREPIETVGTADPAVVKAVFNLWVDLLGLSPGLHRFDLVLTDAAGWKRRRTERIAVAAPIPPAGAGPLDSDKWVTLASGDARSVVEQVRAAPSVMRPVEQVMMTPPAILVLRTDQLGDMVVSIPALRRLRALFPAARIVGLLTAANADLARSLGLFDEVLVVDFPDDPVRQRRTMTIEAQRALAARLAPYRSTRRSTWRPAMSRVRCSGWRARGYCSASTATPAPARRRHLRPCPRLAGPPCRQGRPADGGN